MNRHISETGLISSKKLNIEPNVLPRVQSLKKVNKKSVQWDFDAMDRSRL
jgi:hypothetical protein